MVTFRDVDGTIATDLSYWYGLNTDKLPWECSPLALKLLHEDVPRIVLDHSSWDYLRSRPDSTGLKGRPKFKELIFVVASGKNLRSSHCFQFVQMQPGELIYNGKSQEIHLDPLDETRFASWDEMQAQQTDLLSWENLKFEFELSFLAADFKEKDEDSLFDEWRRQKAEGLNGSWPEMTFMSVKKSDATI